MAEQTPTRVHVDPPMDQWQVTPRHGRTQPVIATGHQPTLWHPGILAKDLAADAFAKHLGGTTLHVVVDHNALGPLAIDVPRQDGQYLGELTIRLDPHATASLLPPNRLPPLDTTRVAEHLADAASGDDLAPDMSKRLLAIADVYAGLPDHPHLAAQASAALHALKRPYLHGDMPTRSTSTLVTPGFLGRLLADPARCVRCYNRAVSSFPEAGIRQLYEGRDVVEAPLWAQGDAGPTPVYIDLGDSKRPQLFTQGQALDLTGPDALQYLRPRAAALSAIMRSEHCDLFIHGTGGGVYDQVTEYWWQAWTGEPLAPMAVVSADLYLGFDAPQGTREQMHRAFWFRGHLPYNLDRFTQPIDSAEAELVREKRRLIEHMDDDRDKRRRSKAFKRIHAINAELCQRHAEELAQSREQAWQARVGVVNADIAARRDWCFALYSESALQDLGRRLNVFSSLTD